MKDNEIKILLLQLIKGNGNISRILDLGVSHKEMQKELIRLIENNLICYKQGILFLSEEGQKMLNELNRQNMKKGLYKYISPKLSDRIPKVDIKDVFIPLTPIKKEDFFRLSHENVQIDESSID